jgi:hypothetical protein
MPPKAKNFICYFFLKTIHKSKGNNHGYNAHSSSYHRKPDDKSGKALLLIKSDAFGNMVG